jgi:hypothetical protein
MGNCLDCLKKQENQNEERENLNQSTELEQRKGSV